MNLIDRDVLIDFMMPYLHNEDELEPSVVIADIRAQPIVEAVPVVHGKWLSAYEFAVKCGMSESMMEKIAVKDEIFWKFCNLCDQQVKGFHNYCPNCGAKMDGGER